MRFSGVTADLVDWNLNMTSAFKIPVYGTLGNHDVAPTNFFPRNTSITPNLQQWVFDTQSQGWEVTV